MYKLIDLFAGCGGMTTGFVKEGFEPVLAVEFDRAAASTYAANHGEEHTHFGDILELPEGSIPQADVVIGGPPCQGFSNLGSKDVEDPRNELWKEYLRVVQIAQPEIFVLENVARFSKTPEFQLLHDEAQGGMLAGYELRSKVLLAADYGVAQRRPRTIVIGSRKGAVDLPPPTHAKEGSLELKDWTTLRSRIDGLPKIPDTTELPDRRASYFGQEIGGEFSMEEIHIGRNPRPISKARYDYIPPGGGRFDLPDELLPRCWRDKKTGTTDVMGRMDWDKPSLTIRTEFFKPEKGRYLHPHWNPDEPLDRVNRPITHQEAALIQDFPDDYVWCGSKIEIARQIGNAVPVGLAAAIAHRVREALDDGN